MKKISDPNEILQAFTRFAYKNNINNVTQWHNQIFIGINKGVEEFEDLLKKAKDRKELVDVKSSIHFYENYVTDNLRNFTLIMHLSNFEEISTLTCHEEGVTIKKSSSIDRFKKCWEKKFKKSLGDIPAWCMLKDAAKIRNAILHGAGRISLNREKEDILKIIKKEKLKYQNDRVYVTEKFLNKVKDAIWEMVQ